MLRSIPTALETSTEQAYSPVTTFDVSSYEYR